MEYQYFEIQFEDEYSMCIRGIREPSLEEARCFCAYEIQMWEADVIMVYPIEEKEARLFYDFDYESDWPVFGINAPVGNMIGGPLLAK